MHRHRTPRLFSTTPHTEWLGVVVVQGSPSFQQVFLLDGAIEMLFDAHHASRIKIALRIWASNGKGFEGPNSCYRGSDPC